MGGFGAFNLDFDLDEILRLQEEEERRQREAKARGVYDTQFSDVDEVPDFYDWQAQVAPGAPERNSALTNWELANRGGWIQPQIDYPGVAEDLSLGDKQAWNRLNLDEQAAAREFLANLAPTPAPATTAPPATTTPAVCSR